MDDSNSDVKKKETKAGRKGFAPTDEQRAAVMRMASERLGHPVIAEEIGISVPTLRKAFVIELKERLGGDNLFVAAGDANPDPVPGPVKARRRGTGGRKRYQPSGADREKVAVLVASGMMVDQIACAMAMTEPTLRKHYRAELETGALRKRGEMLMALNRAALKGNVAAVKESLAIMDRANLEALQDQLRGKGKTEAPSGGATSPQPTSDPIGKKAQADLDAHGVVMFGPWAELVRTPRKA